MKTKKNTNTHKTKSNAKQSKENRRNTMKNNRMTTAETKTYTINDIAAGQLPPEGLFAMINEFIDYLSMQATLVRGMLTSLDYPVEIVQDLIDTICGIGAAFDDGVKSMQTNNHPLVSRELIAKILEKEPEEFSLLPQYVLAKLTSIGWTEEESLNMIEDYPWVTPNFTMPPTEALGPVVFHKTLVRIPEEFTIGLFAQYRHDGSEGELRVAAKAPAKQKWGRISDHKKAFSLLPRGLKMAQNFQAEVRELCGQVNMLRDLLSFSGVTTDQSQDFIAKFTWSGAKYGVRAQAPMFEKPYVA